MSNKSTVFKDLLLSGKFRKKIIKNKRKEKLSKIINRETKGE